MPNEEKVIEMTGEQLEKHVKSKVDTAVEAAAKSAGEKAKKDAEKEAAKNVNPFFAADKIAMTEHQNEKTQDAFYAVALESYKTGEAMYKTAEKMSAKAEGSVTKDAYRKVQWAEENRTASEKASITMRSNEIIIPEVISSLVPEKLEPNMIVRSMQGYNMVNLDRANYRINKEETTPSASWIDYEGATAATSDYTFTPIELTPRKVQSKVILSREAMTASSVLTNQRIAGKLDRAMANAEDLAFLYGTGIGAEPKGIDNLILAANVVTSTATTYQTFYKEIFATMRLPRKAGGGNIATNNMLIITSSDVIGGMVSFMTPEGLIPFAAVANGKIGQYKSIESNHVKMNIGSGSGESEMFFVNMNDFVIGRAAAKTLKVLVSGAVTDGSSTITLDDTNQVAFVMTETVDFGMVRNNTSAKLDEIGLF